MPNGDLSLQEPPALPEAQGQGMRVALTYLPMALMSGVMVLMFTGGAHGATSYLMAGMMVVATGSMAVGQLTTGGGDRKRKLAAERRDYLRYLAQNRRRIREAVTAQRDAAGWRHPHPQELWTVAMTSRRWERRAGHPDFAELRIGTGEQRLAVRIRPMQTKPVDDLDPVSAKALRRFIRAYSTLADQPVAVYLRGFSRIHITGDLELARGVVRALLAQLATFHAPDEALVAVLTGGVNSGSWEWVKWLPHTQHPTIQDAAGAARLIADSPEELDRLLGEDFTARGRYEPDSAISRDEPYLVLVADGPPLPAGSRWLTGGYRNAVLVDLGPEPVKAAPATLCVEATAAGLVVLGQDRVGHETRSPLADPDHLSLVRAAALARRVAPYRLGLVTETNTESLATDFDLASLLGITDLVTLDLGRAWADRGQADRLRVPIGIGPDGTPVDLDLKESALGGMGPHGMLIGATGSGKSELLRTLVLALALTHSSETLNLILVDFKGGATFLGLDRLPHTSAVITNLADEVALVSRMQDALHGEMIRRQELLRSAGGYSSVLDYERARAHGAALDPLPTLFVVVDEFSELLAAHRDFIELFVMIGRLGRSLGVHLLLASQRLDDGRIGQLESHLSYRIGLRTFSAMESRSVIGVPDAYELPPSPGNGYLRADVTTLVRFKAAYVSGGYRPRTARVRQEMVRQQVVPYLAGHVPYRLPDPAEPGTGPAETTDDDSPGRPRPPTVLDVIVDQLADQGPPAHQVWLPPLAEPPSLDQLLPPLMPDPVRGLHPVDWPGAGRLTAPVGFVDKPLAQLRDLMVVDVSGVGGHVGVAGGPQAGKSTLLRTLICALALTHSPREVQFYCLDFGGGTLAALTDLPHVGSVCGRLDTERVGRTVAEITALVSARERRFAELGVDSMTSYRQMRADGRVTDDPYGDVFLVVDGWFTLRQDFETAEAAVRHLVARGLNYGVHLMLTTARWSEVYHGMRDQIGTRLELRLGDPVDSAIDMRLAGTVPVVAGRGLTTDRLHFLGALPRIDGSGDAETVTTGLGSLVDTVTDCWAGANAPAVRTLPLVLPAEELPEPAEDLRVPLGWGEEDLQPVWISFDDTPHLTVLGDTESGKSNLLRLLIRAVTRRFSPAEARIMVVDYRRQLFSDVPDAYRIGYSFSADSTRPTVADAIAGLQPRVPGADIAPDRLRLRDWWTGPRLIVLVDDYEMLSGHDGPLLPLLPFLSQGADIGFHLVLTRGAAGATRMSMDPIMRRLQETNTPDLALSCPPNEGPLLGGVKPRLLPPGRALLCTRRGSRLVHTALCPPAGP
ncbi:type VII secretion protein EccCa [Micromonospora sp. Llam7]|uniref:type VII secretion protein EccCa n=1 Tax=Micromonospora tarapacensis TaxID=2835305 RepID=UPI001C83F523|nr:type VII secretion protein EccCa [Micromonospora tarapacensis]MBX7266392.1 type VII secretion protein EccCa [Micromonospora tarapacensis]